MKKLDSLDPETKSLDAVTENIARLRELFPEAWTEGQLDFDVLKQLLGGVVADGEEKYGLNWHGKRQARQIALTPSAGTLRPCPEESVDWDTTQNLMIEGDNLEVLKLLQKSYARSARVIYIDPPYNRGTDLVYHDDLHDSIRNYQRLTGQTDEDGQPLSSNRETSGRFHTDWLTMMLPRIMLARRLLRDDGVMLISIDDHEVDKLRLVCDELFGEENFVAQLFWEKGRKNDAKLFSIGHDYILVYARSVAKLTENGTRWREAKPGAEEVQAEYLRLKEIYALDLGQIERSLRAFYTALPKSHASKKLARYSHVDQHGVWRDDNMSWPGGGGPAYDVVHPQTGLPCAVPDGGWRYSTPAKMQQMIDAGRVLFRVDHTSPPIRKTYLVRLPDDEDESDDAESDDAAIQVAGTYFYRSALQASNLMQDLFGKKVFDSPKDHEIIARWIRYVTSPSRDDLVIDFFAGSGTTGHAVMELNARDSGQRRFILVQLPQPLDPANADHRIAAKFCDESGKPRRLSEITKERLRRIGVRFRQGDPPFRGDVGFRVFRLDDSNVRLWESDSDNLALSLQRAVDHLREDRSEQDVLFELLLKLGLDLAIPAEQQNIGDCSIWNIGGGRLFVCLSNRIANVDLEPLALGIVAWHTRGSATTEPAIVFRDSAFEDDVAKTNLVAILEQHGLSNVRSV